MKDVNVFINELPKKIEWVKDLSDNELKQIGMDSDFYKNFFNIWKELNYTPELQSLAKKANTIVYEFLTNDDQYKCYKNPLGYELSDVAKRYYWLACDVYNYVIWLQAPYKFPDCTKKYMERISKKWKIN